jgi:hypothetical protein
MRVARLSLLLPAMAVLATPAEGAMHLGVNTHFDQGWPIVALDEAESARAQSIRDTISWGKVEQAPGDYDFTAANSGYVARACAAHMPVLLILTPRNKRYDNGETVFSPLGRRAFAAFAVEIAKRFPCVTGFEIGNEINGHALKGRMVQQMPGSYVAIVREVRAALTGQHAKVKLLSGSSLSVATGFFDRLFGAGLLPLVDGVVIHPYVAVPEQLPGQIARLRSAMARHGGVKPIWASEFGFYYETPEDAPPHALKMITLLSAAGIEEAHWYALRDEKWFPNMGLFANGRGKPALDSFRLAAQLLASGEARRIDAGDPLTFIYRYGNGPYVMWGGGRGNRLERRSHRARCERACCEAAITAGCRSDHCGRAGGIQPWAVTCPRRYADGFYRHRLELSRLAAQGRQAAAGMDRLELDALFGIARATEFPGDGCGGDNCPPARRTSAGTRRAVQGSRRRDGVSLSLLRGQGGQATSGAHPVWREADLCGPDRGRGEHPAACGQWKRGDRLFGSLAGWPSAIAAPDPHPDPARCIAGALCAQRPGYRCGRKLGGSPGRTAEGQQALQDQRMIGP